MSRLLKYTAVILFSFITVGVAFAADYLPKITKNGEQHISLYPVLLVEFEDVKFSVGKPKENFDDMLNKKGYSAGGAKGSVADYLNENFKGKREFRFEVSDVITLPYPIAVYGAPGVNFNDSNPVQLILDACNAASEAGVDFSIYDNDGDGYVDNVSVIFAGYSESEGGAEQSIWPHQGYVELEDVLPGDVKLSSYTCTAELKGSVGVQIAPIGTICHEFSHYLGLQDLYDTNGEEEGLSPAMYGTLSIMDKGNLTSDGNLPPYYNALEREILGISEIVDLLPDTSYAIKPINESDVIYRIPTANEGEYFLLECRVAQGWDANIGGSGLVVYHIDKSDKMCGGLTAASRWKYNNINCLASHECARVISAAGPVNAVGRVFFPGEDNVVELVSDKGVFPLRDWAGHSVGIGITDIKFNSSEVSFKTIGDYAFDFSMPPVIGAAAHPYQRDIRVDWQPASPEMEGEGLQWLVRWWKRGESSIEGEMVQKSSRCYINGVLPGAEYEVQVCSIRGNLYGEPSKVRVKTLPVTSLFPYIYVSENGYSEGDVIDLRLLNLVEGHNYVKWFVDGVEVKGESVTLKDGKYEIMATISYKDGSYEWIYKRIRVEK